jgi:hypothetical protein
MAEVGRISADEAHEKVGSGQALLVCAYDDDVKCSRMALEGAITLNELRARLPSLPKTQEVIFFCA